MKLLVPYVLFLAAFTCYMHLAMREWWLTYPLVLISGYLLLIEIRGFTKDPFGYFFQVWNYLDIVPPIMILFYLGLDYTGYFDDLPEDRVEIVNTEKAVMKGIMSLFIWLKLLYFMRIFKATGYLIRSIIHVCIDMRSFILILFLTLMAFGEAIEAISESSEEPFTGYLKGIGYTYTMILGGFDVSHFDGAVATGFLWFLFITCSILVMIIMLNLLIAIVSDSFEEVKEVAEQANYRERAKIICENLYLVPQPVKDNFVQKDSYLLLAIDTQQELDQTEESLDEKVKQLKQYLKEEQLAIYKKLKDRMKKQHSELQGFLGVGAGLASKLGGSKYGGSVKHAPHGTSSHGHH